MRPARIPRSVPQSKPKPDLRRNAKHRDFIRNLPCLSCGGSSPQCECAHVRASQDGGMGMRPGDRFTVPLCPMCHRLQHQYGETAFWGARGIDPLDAAHRLWTVSGDDEAGQRIIFRAQQRIGLGRL